MIRWRDHQGSQYQFTEELRDPSVFNFNYNLNILKVFSHKILRVTCYSSVHHSWTVFFSNSVSELFIFEQMNILTAVITEVQIGSSKQILWKVWMAPRSSYDTKPTLGDSMISLSKSAKRHQGKFRYLPAYIISHVYTVRSRVALKNLSNQLLKNMSFTLLKTKMKFGRRKKETEILSEHLKLSCVMQHSMHGFLCL